MTEEQEEYIPDIKNEENDDSGASGGATEHSSTALTPWKQVESEWNAPLSIRALLVRSQTTVTRQMVELATDVARRYGLPIAGVNIIPSKAGPQPYVNSDGIRWRLHMDRREFQSSIGEIVHMPTEEEKYIIARARVEMKDGSSAENMAIADWPASGKDTTFSLGDLCMKMITKAKRRAGADLVGVGLPIYDEYYDAIEGQFTEIEQETEEHKAEKKSPDNLSELISFAKQRYDLKLRDLLELMGVQELSDLDIQETWKKVMEKYGKDQQED